MPCAAAATPRLARVPTFCRHGRFVERCPICTRQGSASERAASGGGASSARRPGRAAKAAESRTRGPGAPRSGGRGVRVTRLARAADDGYRHDLVPGLRAADDARRLAAEIAFADARLALMASEPPGLYAEAAGAQDAEEGLWLLLLITYLGPLEGPEPFAAIAEARTVWSSGERPDPDGAALGPRTAHEAGRGPRSLDAWRARAEAAGSQVAALGGEPGWGPERRFAQAFERAGVDGVGRDARMELLVAAGALGLLDVAPDAQHLGSRTPVVAAARRLFAIAEVPLLERRARELASACGVPLAALDLALWNWGEPERRTTMGAGAAEAHADPSRALRALDVADTTPE